MPRVLLVLIVVLTSNSYVQTSKLTKFPAPVAASVDGYDKGHCISLPKNVRICKLLSDDKDTFLVQRDGKNVGTWAASAFLAQKRSKTSKSGIIEAVTREKESIRIVFKPDGEQSATLMYQGSYQDNELEYLGNAATGRVYPKNYLPSKPETWLKNKRAILRTYEYNGRDGLWLERRK